MADPDTTYTNPVYNDPAADPFVLKWCGTYWAYCTGLQSDGRAFGVLHSHDLVTWRALGGALTPLPGDFPDYWAAEVTYINGIFYMYYSVGNEERMTIRVATATRPAGPFTDSGRALTGEDFAIDPHVFTDNDGARYLFYATDFLHHTRIGTGTVQDRLVDPFTLAGQPRPVTRALYDWQVYDPNRTAKGGVRWHTIEGPFVLKHKGRYYQMFSGGNWQNASYGVSVATTDSIATAVEWTQTADGAATLPILRTISGQVIGPGHNSVVRGPDNRQLYCIYHRWSEGSHERVLAIDPLDFAGDQMVVLGPSTTPQPAPIPPTFADFFDTNAETELGPQWMRVDDMWTVRDGVLQCRDDGESAVWLDAHTSAFAVEVSIRAIEMPQFTSRYGVSIMDDAGETPLIVGFDPDNNQFYALPEKVGGGFVLNADLPPQFDYLAYHLLRLDVDGTRVRLSLDDRLYWQGNIDAPVTTVSLWTDSTAVAFTGFALTVGWEDLFVEAGDPAAYGWAGDTGWTVADGCLWSPANAAETRLVKGEPLTAYELVVNLRRVSADGAGRIGVYPACTAADFGPLLTIERGAYTWALVLQDTDTRQEYTLPSDFDPASFQQFRIRKEGGRLQVRWAAFPVFEILVTDTATAVGLYAQGARAAFDMLRLTGV